MQLSAGTNHSAVLTTSGEVLCFGANHYGQCGMKLCLYSMFHASGMIQNTHTKKDCGDYHP